MKEILITGCSGFLGKHLSKFLLDKDCIISGITEISSFKSKAIKVYHCDIRDREGIAEILKKEKPSTIFHLAAIASVGFSWKNEYNTYEINFLGSLNLLEAVFSYSPHSKVILMSSAEVYGKKEGVITEESNVEIRNPYSLSKYAMEILGDLFVKSKNLNIIKTRSFNFSGPGQSLGFVVSDFAFQIAKIEKGEQDPQIKVGDLSICRDFSDVRDIVRYLYLIDLKGQNHKTYNLCSGKVYSIKNLLDILLNLSKIKIQVVVDKTKLRPVDIPILKGSNSLIRRELGTSAEYAIKQTLEDTLNYWRARV